MSHHISKDNRSTLGGPEFLLSSHSSDRKVTGLPILTERALTLSLIYQTERKRIHLWSIERNTLDGLRKCLSLKMLVSQCLTIVTPWTVACQGPLSMEFSRKKSWVSIPFSRGFSQPRDRIQVSCTADRFFTVWATREAKDGKKEKVGRYKCVEQGIKSSFPPWGSDALPEASRVSRR